MESMRVVRLCYYLSYLRIYDNNSYPCLFHALRIILPSPFIFNIATLTYFATSNLVGGLVVPWTMPSAIIQLNHCRWI